MTEPTIVIAGVGRFGALHARVWREAGARLVGFVDPDGARLARVAAGFGVDATDTGLAPLLARVRPEVVVIASDEASHAELAITALGAGCGVFVEKPLALTSADARRIAAAARTAGREVVVGHISRFSAPMARMRSRVAAGAVGTLCALRLRRDFSRTWYASFGDRVHPVFESCVHDIDLAISFVRRPAIRVMAMRAEAAGDAAPSVVTAAVEFEGGVIATIESAWLVPSSAPATLDGGPLALDGAILAETEVWGLDGVLRHRLVSDAYAEWTTAGTYAPDLSLWPEEDGAVGGALRREVTYALDVLTGRGAPSTMPLEEACWGIEIAEAIVRSLETRAPTALSSRR